MLKEEFISVLNEFKLSLESKGFPIKGCDDNQILILEKKYGKSPLYYKIFLSFLGIDSCDFKKGTDILYSEIDDINECTIELMNENKIDIPNRFFAFLLHQGYSALLFLDTEDNPRVYCYTEGEELKTSSYSFSEYILTEIELYKKYS